MATENQDITVNLNQQQGLVTNKVKGKLTCLVSEFETKLLHDWSAKVRKLLAVTDLKCLVSDPFNKILRKVKPTECFSLSLNCLLVDPTSRIWSGMIQLQDGIKMGMFV